MDVVTSEICMSGQEGGLRLWRMKKYISEWVSILFFVRCISYNVNVAVTFRVLISGKFCILEFSLISIPTKWLQYMLAGKELSEIDQTLFLFYLSYM